MDKPCTHPPKRLYTGTYHEPVMIDGKPDYEERTWIVCLDCQEVLTTAATFGKQQRPRKATAS